jgi:hypothetical protein
MTFGRALYILIMFANLGLVLTNSMAGNWVKVWVCGGAFVLMGVGLVGLGLGQAAKRGDRVEPDREAGQ